MPAINPQDLLTEASCYLCLGPVTVAQTIRLALLRRILLRLDPSADVTPQGLTTYAMCYLCLGGSLADAVEMALLDQINNATGGVPSTIAVTQLANYSGINSAAHVTGSFTPEANALILALVSCNNSASFASPIPVSLTGNGLTWVLVNSVNGNASGKNLQGCAMYRAMGSSPSAGTLTVNMPTAGNAVTVQVLQITGADTSGTNGSGAIVQSATTGGSPGAATMNLSAISSLRNMVIAASSNVTNPWGGTPESGWTESLDSGAAGTIALGGYVTYILASTDNIISIAGSASAWTMVGAEIKAA